MAGYILNTDPIWFKNIKDNGITNPVFWFRREKNPSSIYLKTNSEIFIRPTKQVVPSITAHGVFDESKVLTVNDAFIKYNQRLGFISPEEMISSSDKWTGNNQLSLSSKIFCFSISYLNIIEPISLSVLKENNIEYDHKHIVTGKGLDKAQTNLILDISRKENDLIRFTEENKNYLDSLTKELKMQVIIRYLEVVKKQKEKYLNKCQIANCAFTFIKKDGSYYSEAHHIKFLSEGGSQDSDNLLILCANHHRMFHYAKIECVKCGDRVTSVIINGSNENINW